MTELESSPSMSLAVRDMMARAKVLPKIDGMSFTAKT
jgi:hypothetical protein